MLLAISECQHLKPFTNLDGTMLKSHIFNALENFGIFFFFFSQNNQCQSQNQETWVGSGEYNVLS